MYGVVNFFKEAVKAGVKPIIGCEVYVAPRSRFDMEHGPDSVRNHLVLLCKNETGYKYLCLLVSRSYTEGFYIKPRIDMELLRGHSEGLVALTACLAGEIPQLLLAGSYDAAKEKALRCAPCSARQLLPGASGPWDQGAEDRQRRADPDPRGNRDSACRHERRALPRAVGRRRAGHSDVHQTGKTVDEADRMRFETEEFYFKSEARCARCSRSIPRRPTTQVRIAEMCNVVFEFGHYHLPEFKLPEGANAADYLKRLCLEGFEKKIRSGQGGRGGPAGVRARDDRPHGFYGLFSYRFGFHRLRQKHGYPVGPGRGSAAGSVASYCLDITTVDPIKYGLYFERFLKPRAREHAGYRHRLLRAPARRGHRVRQAQIRRGPRGPDRDVQPRSRPKTPCATWQRPWRSRSQRRASWRARSPMC